VGRRRQNLAQLEIPVNNEIGRKHDPDESFEREFGTERAERERKAYVEARRCTCGSSAPNRWGARNGHKPPCPRAGAKF
jgi:hypothetical protein